MPQVSVIVPVFNTVEYVAECLDSVLAQSVQDLEVVCVDDGSTDGSAEVLHRYADQDSRVVVVTQPNRGLGAARNAGADVATGQYVWFVDSDDLVSERAVEELAAAAVAADLDVLHFDAVPFCDEGASAELTGTLERYRTYYRRSHEYPGIWSGQDLMAAMVEHGEYRPSVCLQLFRTDFIREQGIAFRDGILHEDNLFTFRCALAAARVGCTARAYYQRRLRDDSIVTSQKSLAHARGYLLTYLDMLQLAGGLSLDSRTAGAVGKIAASMYRGAATALAALPSAERHALAPEEDSVIGHATVDTLKRYAAQVDRAGKLDAKSRRAEKRLKRAQYELDKIKDSRVYRIATAVRRVIRAQKR